MSFVFYGLQGSNHFLLSYLYTSTSNLLPITCRGAWLRKSLSVLRLLIIMLSDGRGNSWYSRLPGTLCYVAIQPCSLICAYTRITVCKKGILKSKIGERLSKWVNGKSKLGRIIEHKKSKIGRKKSNIGRKKANFVMGYSGQDCLPT